MKLNEITDSHVQEIEEWLKSVTWNHKLPSYGIGKNGEINIHTGLRISNATYLPFKFGYADRGFSVKLQRDIKTFENFPEIITGDLNIIDTGITSLEGIGDIIKEIHGTLYFNTQKIKSGGLGLVQIAGLLGFSTKAGEVVGMQWNIISKYLEEPDKIFDCQQELIEAGFDEFAKL